MKHTIEKVAALEGKVDAAFRRVQRSFRIMLIAYVILVLAVVLYTSWLVTALQQATTPQALGEHLSAYLSTALPELRQRARAEYDRSSEEWADAAISGAIEQLPAVENTLQTQMNKWTDLLVEKIEADLLAGFGDYLKEASKDLKDEYGSLKGDEVVDGAALLFADAVEEELDKLINDDLLGSLSTVQQQLREVSRPRDQLTKRQDAIRRMIAYTVYLRDHDEVRKQVFADLAEVLSDEWNLGALPRISIDSLLQYQDLLPEEMTEPQEPEEEVEGVGETREL